MREEDIFLEDGRWLTDAQLHHPSRAVGFSRRHGIDFVVNVHKLRPFGVWLVEDLDTEPAHMLNRLAMVRAGVRLDVFQADSLHYWLERMHRYDDVVWFDEVDRWTYLPKDGDEDIVRRPRIRR